MIEAMCLCFNYFITCWSLSFWQRLNLICLLTLCFTSYISNVELIENCRLLIMYLFQTSNHDLCIYMYHLTRNWWIEFCLNLKTNSLRTKWKITIYLYKIHCKRCLIDFCCFSLVHGTVILIFDEIRHHGWDSLFLFKW